VCIDKAACLSMLYVNMTYFDVAIITSRFGRCIWTYFAANKSLVLSLIIYIIGVQKMYAAVLTVL